MRCKLFFNIAISSLIFVSLTSCNKDGTINKQAFGTGAGAAIGGLVGSLFGSGSGRLIAVGVGAVAGGIAGNYIGKDMDEQDEQNVSGALSTVPAGKTVGWKNKKGSKYTFKPTDESESTTVIEEKNGQKHRVSLKCRKYVQTVNIDGKTEKAHGMACLNHGKWEIVSPSS